LKILKGYTYTPKFEYEGAGKEGYTRKVARFGFEDRYKDQILSLVPNQYRRIVRPVVEGGYFDFHVATIVESCREKEQIVELMNDSFTAYYFGEHPVVIDVQGYLLDVYEADERHWFTVLYRYVLRGTKLATLGIPVKLYVMDWRYIGALNSFRISTTADNYTHRAFGFSMLLLEPPKCIGQVYTYPEVREQASLATAERSVSLASAAKELRNPYLEVPS